MIQALIKNISLSEFLQLPETEPASEFINGQIFAKPMPQGQHSTIQGELVTLINSILKQQGIARAFPELRCTFGERSLVPDVAVFIQSRIPRLDNGKIANVFEAAPDWTIEILSPAQSATQVLKKISHCLDFGSQMGWLIDPETESVFVCELGKQFTVLDEPDLPLPLPTFAANLDINVGDIFAWLRD
jgi:Uma2 family endonuclease